MALRDRGDPGQGSGTPRYSGSFLLAFREAAAGIGWQLQRLTQDVAQCSDAAGQEHVLGLENLYRRARRTPREDWPQLIADFLKTIASAEESSGLPDELAAVTNQLLPRLGRPLHVEEVDARVWAQPIPGTDLVVNLVVDYPDRMCYVTERLIAESGTSGDAWRARAESNLLTRTPADCFQVVHEESGLRVCTAADSYDAARALVLDRLLPEPEHAGHLVVLPGRDELLVLPVTLKAKPHFHLMKVLAEKNFPGAPYPISDEVYWVQEGLWLPVPIDVETNSVNTYPPELVDALNRLSALAEFDSDDEHSGEG